MINLARHFVDSSGSGVSLMSAESWGRMLVSVPVSPLCVGSVALPHPRYPRHHSYAGYRQTADWGAGDYLGYTAQATLRLQVTVTQLHSQYGI